MSDNKINENQLSESEKAQAYDDICDLLGIGSLARNSTGVAMHSIENIKGFSEKLFAIENEYFMQLVCEEDEEPQWQSLINPWGDSKEEFVKNFGEAMKTIGIDSPVNNKKIKVTIRQMNIVNHLVKSLITLNLKKPTKNTTKERISKTIKKVGDDLKSQFEVVDHVKK